MPANSRPHLEHQAGAKAVQAVLLFAGELAGREPGHALDGGQALPQGVEHRLGFGDLLDADGMGAPQAALVPALAQLVQQVAAQLGRARQAGARVLGQHELEPIHGALQGEVQVGEFVQQVFARAAGLHGRDHAGGGGQRADEVLVEFTGHDPQRHAGVVQGGAGQAQGRQRLFGDRQQLAQRRHAVGREHVGVARAIESLVVLGHCPHDVARVVGELAEQQLAHMGVHHELPVGVDIERGGGVGLAIFGRDVHLADVVQQPSGHGLADEAFVATPRVHERASHGHGFQRVREGRGACGFDGAEQQLHHGMQADAGHAVHQGGHVGAQQRAEHAFGVNEAGQGLFQAGGCDPVLGDQAGFQRFAQGAVHQLALQVRRDGLVACPEFHPVDVEDVAGGDDRPGLAGFQDGGQGVGVGDLEVAGCGVHGVGAHDHSWPRGGVQG